jgi:RHS repeat-associated protein
MPNQSPNSSLIITGLKHTLLALAVVILGFANNSYGQGPTSPLDGFTPTGLAPGAPAGSYALSGFDTVNPYNGGLNFNLPLYHIGGRGSAGYTIQLPIEQKWHVNHSVTDDGQGSVFHFFDPDYNWWTPGKPGYSVGAMYGRQVGTGYYFCPYSGLVPDATLTRFTFTAADGTEYELRDVLTDGQPRSEICGSTTTFNRGRVFKTADGSAATFISDTDVTDSLFVGSGIIGAGGYLMLKDGTRYRIEGGIVKWIRDRNGNKITFGGTENGCGILTGCGQPTTITDSLNRTVSIEYNVNDSQYGQCDRITYKGFGGQDRIIRVGYKPLQDALKSGFAIQTDHTLFPELNNASTTTYHNPVVVSNVWLPDGRSYNFYYNSYSELARVELPTGGAFEYDYSGGIVNGPASGVVCPGCNGSQIYRRVVERRTCSSLASCVAGTALDGKTTFSRPDTETLPGGWQTADNVQVNHWDPNGNLLAAEKHYYFGGSGLSDLGPTDPAEYSNSTQGKEYKTESLDTDGSTVLRRQTMTWQQPVAGATWPSGPFQTGGKNNDAQITQTVTTLVDTNQVSQETFSYDRYSNKTDTYEYDFGSGSAGALLRRTHIDFLTTNPVNGQDYACDPTSTCGLNANIANVIHLRGLPNQQSVFDSDGTTERTRTTFEYDNYSGADTFHAGLKDWPAIDGHAISGLDSGFTASFGYRGNATASTRYLLTANQVTGSISAYTQFDLAGQPVRIIDPRSTSSNIIATDFSYLDCFGAPGTDAETNTSPTELGSQRSYALLTKVTNALGQISFAKRDYYLGAAINGEDVNGTVSAAYYDDLLDRPTKLIRAVNDSRLKNQLAFNYDDTARTISTLADQNSFDDSNPLKTVVIYDGLGRTVENRIYEDGTKYTTVQRSYDGLGRAARVSNPYRPLSPDSETPAWTTTAYDSVGRVISVTTPDNAIARNTYNGNQLLVTDQAQVGKQRVTKTNALGQLSEVWEITTADGATESISFPNHSEVTAGYRTSYAYDVLGDLTTVTQRIGTSGSTQTRSFAYDSLKRLTSATNPENGVINYQYDANGNLTVKADPRGVSAHYAYDALNRPVRRWYNSSSALADVVNNDPALPTSVAATDEVNLYYDSATLPNRAPSFDRGSAIGRLVAVTYGGQSASKGTYRGYDALGRIVRQYQQTDKRDFLVEAQYNFGNAITSETYPSGRVVSYGYDQAGRMESATAADVRNNVDASVSDITYAPHGGLRSETYGNDLLHGVSYNIRLQVNEITLGDSSSSSSLLDLNYNYGTTYNNGNLLSVTYSGAGLSNNQTFTYDSLNRLAAAKEEVSTSTQWTQTNGYDRYGNRWIDLGGGSQNLHFDTSTNRITSGAFSYDAAGNLTHDENHSYVFDAENKISKVDDGPAYLYDGEGQRVIKLTADPFLMIYDQQGKMVAEYQKESPDVVASTLADARSVIKEYVYGASGLLATIRPEESAEYATADHLGTPRVVTGRNGSVVSRHDYKPFGEEIGAGVGGRTTDMGFSVEDGLRQQFTAKERDNETGLDYFGARYYGSTQGRFTSVDPLLSSGRAVSPQSWNRYAYALNDPTRLIDPNGLEAADPDEQSGTQKQVVKPLESKMIAQRLDEIRKNAKPLAEGEKPVATSVEQIAGEQVTLKNAQVEQPGEEPIDVESGYMKTSALVVLDQGGNIMTDPENMTITEKVTPANDTAKEIFKNNNAATTNDKEVSQQPNGAFYDIQIRGQQSSNPQIVETNQNLIIKSGGKGLFMIDNKIRQNDANKSTTTTAGKPQKFY